MVLIAQWMPLGPTDGRHSIVGHLLLFGLACSSIQRYLFRCVSLVTLLTYLN